MKYCGEILHGNNPEDWETVRELRSDRLGLYGDGLQHIYDKNERCWDIDEANAKALYDAMYPDDSKNDWVASRAGGKRAYNKACRILHNL